MNAEHNHWKLAAIQMNSGPDLDANLEQAAELLRSAADQGAQVAALPENFAFMGRHERDKLALQEREPEDGAQGTIQQFLSVCAAELNIWLLGGSVPMVSPDPDRILAAALLYDPQGQRVARYDKIHLFDVETERDGRTERYAESASIHPGALSTVVAESALGGVGLSICYDLRFPELYRDLVGQGAELLMVPAAFTRQTGEAHWEALIRARAIENQCVVVAPNQCGSHPGERQTWGHSLIVDAWGRVLAQGDDQPGVVIADWDRDQQRALRQRFPVLDHRRLD